MNGLAKDYGSKMNFVIKKKTDSDAEALIAKYELEIHGMVVTDLAGAVKWKESGHKQTRKGVEAAIKKLLGE